MPVKPANLIYGVDDRPPWWATVLLGLQHVSVFAVSLLFPAIIAKQAGLGVEESKRMVSVSMIAAGIGAVAQATRGRRLGSGYLCPSLCGPSFVSSSVLAAQTGGLSLVFGMTVFAGALEAAFSRVLKYLRFLFPAEVTGLIVAMVGITVAKTAVQLFFGTGGGAPTHTLVAAATLAIMVGLNVWTSGKLRLFCVVIGMAVGYVLAALAGILDQAHLRAIVDSPWAYFPLAGHPGWSFSPALVLPFGIAAICSSLKSVGDITTCQRINDAEWKRPDMDNVSRGILADAVGAISAGVLGGMGQSTSSSNVGLTIATAATSRVIAYAIAGLLLVLAFCPRLAAIVVVMPEPVTGAALLFSISFMVVAGFQIVMSRMMDARKTFVVGLPLILGLGVDMVPEAFAAFPAWSQAIFGSSLSTATVAAVLLNLVLRIGVAAKAGIELPCTPEASRRVYDFMQRQGGTWGARPEVIHKATAAMGEFLESATRQQLAEGLVSMEVRFDEFRLDVDIRYRGRPMLFADTPPTPAELLDDPDAIGRMASHLIRQYADSARTERSGDECRVRLHFDH